MSFYGVYIPSKSNFEGSVEKYAGSIAAINYDPIYPDSDDDFAKPEDPEYPLDSPLWLVFYDKCKALEVLRHNKDARLREFPDLESAERYVQFGFESLSALKLCGKAKSKPIKPHNASVAAESTNINIERPPFRAPTKQELVEFRKMIEVGDYARVQRTIWDNPRYLISCGDTPTNLKEGYRYNAMHICAQFNQSMIAELILSVVSSIKFANLYTGKRANPKMCAVLNNSLLDYYLNIPDKGRSETPLHFAVKNGHILVVRVLTSYPECKSLPNKDGQLPKDIICQRVKNPDPEMCNRIEMLLTERFYVPVLRAPDNAVPPQIGQPFSSNDPPNYAKPYPSSDPKSPDLKIQAIAGPMNKDQAHKFCRRWKTPPRIGSKTTSPLANNSYMSPMKSIFANLNYNRSVNYFGSPLHRRIGFSPRRNSINTKVNSLEFHKLSIAEDDESDMSAKSIDKQNGNSSKSSQNPFSMDSPTLQNGFTANANTSSNMYLETSDIDIDNVVFEVEANNNNNSTPCGSPAKNPQLDLINTSSLSNDNSSLVLNDSFKERHIKNSDVEKGLEVIGRQLAKSKNIEWTEYWDFFDAFVDVGSVKGLERLENYFIERRAKQESSKCSRQLLFKDVCRAYAKQETDKSRILLTDVCQALDKIDSCLSRKSSILSAEFESLMSDTSKSLSSSSSSSSNSATSSGNSNSLTSGNLSTITEINITQMSTPYTCAEKSLQVFAKRITKVIKNNILDIVSINDTLLSELKRLKTLIGSFKEDKRFTIVDFSKVHARISNLVAIYIEQSQEVSLAQKLKIQSALRELAQTSGDKREHFECVCVQMVQMLENPTDKSAPEKLTNEELCLTAWMDEKSCDCQWDTNLSRKTSRRKRTETFYSKQQHVETKDIEMTSNNFSKNDTNTAVAIIAPLTYDTWQDPIKCSTDDDEYYDDNDDDDDGDTFLSISSSDDEENDDGDDNAFYYTPLQSPPIEVNEERYKCFIFGDEPTKRDLDVLNALSHIDIEKRRYPHIYDWKEALMSYSNDEMDLFPSPALIRQTHKPLLPVTPLQKCSDDSDATNYAEMLITKPYVKGKRLFPTPKLQKVMNLREATLTANTEAAAAFAAAVSAAASASAANVIGATSATPTEVEQESELRTASSLTTATTTATGHVAQMLKTPLNRVRGLFHNYRESSESSGNSWDTPTILNCDTNSPLAERE